MDDEKKWNLNAPQNDTENNRQNEPPRYEHYCMHQNTESDTVKELPEKKKTKTWRKKTCRNDFAGSCIRAGSRCCISGSEFCVREISGIRREGQSDRDSTACRRFFGRWK